MKIALITFKQGIGNKYLLLVLRLLLGGIFLLSAFGKLPDRAAFVDVVTGFGLLPLPIAMAYGIVLPWLELTVGWLLVTGFFTRYAAGASMLMIASFIVANGTAVYSNRPADCDCFGKLVTMKVSDALVIDIVIIVVAAVLVVGAGGAFSIDGITDKKTRTPD